MLEIVFMILLIAIIVIVFLIGLVTTSAFLWWIITEKFSKMKLNRMKEND